MSLPGSEDEMKQKIALGDYAYVSVRLNLDDGKSGISICKKPYNSDVFSVVTLDVQEWSELAHQMESLADSASEMDAGADAAAVTGESASPTSYPSKLLSTRVMAKLNLFAAPNGQRYVTMAVRPYVMDNKTSVLKLKKEGVTLNMKEILCLREKKSFISEVVEEQTASTYHISLYNTKDLVLAQKRLEHFFVKASAGQKLRMIAEKKSTVVASDAPELTAKADDDDDYDNDATTHPLPPAKRAKRVVGGADPLANPLANPSVNPLANSSAALDESQSSVYISDEEDTLIVDAPNFEKK